MNDEFKKAFRESIIPRTFTSWDVWLGMPMIYDGGLCVNRTLEEHIEHAKHPKAKLEV